MVKIQPESLLNAAKIDEKTQTGYLLGIGSNINPDENIAQIIALLLEHFSTFSLSRIIRIPPIGMNSNLDFLNTVAFIKTDTREQELKEICNNIEIQLGRDRNDPTRKMKDRTADLDILTAITFPTDNTRSATDITDEYFLYPLIDELFAYLSSTEYLPQQTGVELTINGLTFGQTATTIHGNTHTSNERVY